MANACHNETCPYGHGCLQKRLGNMCRAKRRGVPLFQELPSDISTVHLVNTAVFFLTVSNWCTLERVSSIRGTLMRSCVMTETVPLQQKKVYKLHRTFMHSKLVIDDAPKLPSLDRVIATISRDTGACTVTSRHSYEKNILKTSETFVTFLSVFHY